MKRLIALFLAVIIIFSATGCSVFNKQPSQNTDSAKEPGADAVNEAQEKVFRLTSTIPATSFDPSLGNSVFENEIHYAINEGLVRTVNGEIKPGVAKSWDVDESGLIWTFHLRDDAKWSDGQPITAYNYEYSWKRFANPNTGSGYAWILSFLENADAVMYEGMDIDQLGVKAIDDKTLEMRLQYVAPYALSIIGTIGNFAPIREDLTEKYGKDFAADASKNVYSGPFVLSELSDTEYILKPNEYYWDRDSINFDKVEIYIITEPSTSLALYENKELDLISLSLSDVESYRNNENHGSFINGNTDWLYINNEDPLLSNKNLRLAINYAINRKEFNALANHSVYSEFTGVVCDEIAGSNGQKFSQEFKDNRIYPAEGNIELAKEYLQKAMDELNFKNPSEIELTITMAESSSTQLVCEVIQELLNKNLGITVKIKPVSYASIYSEIFPNHDYQLGYGGWSPDYDDPYTYLELFLSTNPANYSAYSNAEVDKLLLDARINPNQQERMENLGRAEKIIIEDGALFPLQMRKEHYLLNENITNVYFAFGSVNYQWIYGDIN